MELSALGRDPSTFREMREQNTTDFSIIVQCHGCPRPRFEHCEQARLNIEKEVPLRGIGSTQDDLVEFAPLPGDRPDEFNAISLLPVVNEHPESLLEVGPWPGINLLPFRCSSLWVRSSTPSPVPVNNSKRTGLRVLDPILMWPPVVDSRPDHSVLLDMGQDPVVLDGLDSIEGIVAANGLDVPINHVLGGLTLCCSGKKAGKNETASQGPGDQKIHYEHLCRASGGST